MVGFRARFPQSWGRIVRPEPTYCSPRSEWVTPLAAHPYTERIGVSPGLAFCQILTGHIPIANSPEHIKQMQQELAMFAIGAHSPSFGNIPRAEG